MPAHARLLHYWSAGHTAADRPIAHGTAGAASSVRALRQAHRTTVDVHAVIYSGLSVQSTIIRNLSEGGAGISGAYGLFPGSKVVIALVTGETRSGVVRWWLAGRCGIQFDQKLGTDDAFRLAVLRRQPSGASARARRDQLP